MYETLEVCQDATGQGWMPVEYCEEAMLRSRKLKENVLTSESIESGRKGFGSRLTGPLTTWTKRGSSNESSSTVLSCFSTITIYSKCWVRFSAALAPENIKHWLQESLH